VNLAALAWRRLKSNTGLARGASTILNWRGDSSQADWYSKRPVPTASAHKTIVVHEHRTRRAGEPELVFRRDCGWIDVRGVRAGNEACSAVSVVNSENANMASLKMARRIALVYCGHR
jgi:hypothetical protein